MEVSGQLQVLVAYIQENYKKITFYAAAATTTTTTTTVVGGGGGGDINMRELIRRNIQWENKAQNFLWLKFKGAYNIDIYIKIISHIHKLFWKSHIACKSYVKFCYYLIYYACNSIKFKQIYQHTLLLLIRGKLYNNTKFKY